MTALGGRPLPDDFLPIARPDIDDADVAEVVDTLRSGWLTYGPNARATESLSHMIDWIKAIFDPVKYPWFRDEFIHPTKLVEMAPADTRVQSVRDSFAAKPFQG